MIGNEILSGKVRDTNSAFLAVVLRKLGVELEPLRAVGGERYASRKKADRRALLAQIGAERPTALVPLVVAMARSDKDLECRVAAVALLSVLGLDAAVTRR